MTTESYSPIVAGVGNFLHCDEGVGIHAVRRLQQQPACGVVYLDLGTADSGALTFVETASHVLVIDAARGNGAPGSIYRFQPEPSPSPEPWSSLHTSWLRDLLSADESDRPKPAVVVLGVEPYILQYGTELSAAVRFAFPELLRLARQQLADWKALLQPELSLVTP
jgi:hydrogenase maturation protease